MYVYPDLYARDYQTFLDCLLWVCQSAHQQVCVSLSKCVHVCASESVFISVSVCVELWISVYFTI